MPVGAVVASAGSTVIGNAVNGANAAGTASQNAATINNAVNTSNALSTQNYATDTANLTPYTTAGSAAANELAGLTGTGGSAAASQAALNNYLGSEQYQFQLGQGQQALETSNATALNSGATDKALLSYGQGLAGSALQGYEGVLENQTGTGLSASSSLGQLGQSEAALQSQNNLAGAGALVSNNNAALKSSQAETSGITGALGGVANNTAVQSALSSALNGGSQSSYGGSTTASGVNLGVAAQPDALSQASALNPSNYNVAVQL